ncbi:hypothetical protein BJV77DRAFT_454412 [Russula vinacea]|nr:hypothetical protein BJV77DRAFT_454412 [Russula vinacea]
MVTTGTRLPVSNHPHLNHHPTSRQARATQPSAHLHRFRAAAAVASSQPLGFRPLDTYFKCLLLMNCIVLSYNCFIILTYTVIPPSSPALAFQNVTACSLKITSKVYRVSTHARKRIWARGTTLRLQPHNLRRFGSLREAARIMVKFRERFI